MCAQQYASSARAWLVSHLFYRPSGIDIFLFFIVVLFLLTFNNLYDVALAQKLCAEMMRLSLVLTALLVGGTSAAVNLDVSSEVTAHKYVSECTAPPYF